MTLPLHTTASLLADEHGMGSEPSVREGQMLGGVQTCLRSSHENVDISYVWSVCVCVCVCACVCVCVCESV